MAGWQRVITTIGGRRAIAALGGLYVAFAIGYTLSQATSTIPTRSELIIFVLMAGPGVVILYTGYRLPRFDIRPEFYSTAATWCLGGLIAMAGILGFYSLQPGEAVDDVSTIGILTALASVAGLAAGIHNAQAKTRAHELERTIDELEATNERLARYQRYTDDILDAIDDVFYVLDEEGTLVRWNESLADVTGYTAEEIESMSATDFIAADAREDAAVIVREGFETGSVTAELPLLTKEGETIPFDFVASTLESPSGETRLAGIGRDVTERVEHEERLEELVDRLEESNERLEQFAYAASHDMQEPLRMVSSYLQLVEQRYGDELDEEGREFIDFAVDGADRMRNMIEGLLEYSRVERSEATFEPVDLNAILDEVRDDLEVRIEESGAEIDVASLPTIEGDPDQLRQVFQNLLDNAIEYSGDDPPRVEISAMQNGTTWEISVCDEGLGIPESDTDRIFEVFESLHMSEDHSGTGIGLALCERIVERHGGEMWVESEPGEGSCFTFSLPENGPRRERQ